MVTSLLTEPGLLGVDGPPAVVASSTLGSPLLVMPSGPKPALVEAAAWPPEPELPTELAAEVSREIMTAPPLLPCHSLPAVIHVSRFEGPLELFGGTMCRVPPRSPVSMKSSCEAKRQVEIPGEGPVMPSVPLTGRLPMVQLRIDM